VSPRDTNLHLNKRIPTPCLSHLQLRPLPPQSSPSIIREKYVQLSQFPAPAPNQIFFFQRCRKNSINFFTLDFFCSPFPVVITSDFHFACRLDLGAKVSVNSLRCCDFSARLISPSHLIGNGVCVLQISPSIGRRFYSNSYRKRKALSNVFTVSFSVRLILIKLNMSLKNKSKLSDLIRSC